MRTWLQLTATDPVCGRQVKIARVAAVVDHLGTTYYFCSQKCGRAFAGAPEQYRAESERRDGCPPPAA